MIRYENETNNTLTWN